MRAPPHKSSGSLFLAAMVTAVWKKLPEAIKSEQNEITYKKKIATFCSELQGQYLSIFFLKSTFSNRKSVRIRTCATHPPKAYLYKQTKEGPFTDFARCCLNHSRA
jgi:hypothetical protein